MRYTSSLIAACFLGTSAAAMASDRFASDSEGMIKALSSTPTIPGGKFRSSKDKLQMQLRGLKRIKTEAGDAQIRDLPAVASSVNLKIEFDYNSYTIRPSSLELINALGHALSDPALTGSTFIVGGHTDSDGDDSYNLNLSLKRGSAVKDYLVSNYNVPASRLQVVGYGETTPIDSNNTGSGKQKNRRVEVLKLQK